MAGLSHPEKHHPGDSMVKNLPVLQEMQVQSLGQEDPLEEGMAAHPSILAWRVQGQRSCQAAVHRDAQTRT